MNLAKWRQEVHHNLEELVAKANRIVPGLMYGALSACTIMPLVTAANQGQVPTSEISNLVGALGMGLITNQLQNWHDRNNDELAAELTDKAKTDSDWKEVLDELLQKLETLHIVQTVASEADKDWLIHTIKDALEVIGSRLVIQIENISNSTGVVIGQNNTQTITQITNHYYQSEKSIDKVILEEQIRKYLEFVRERYGTVSLRNTKSESIYPLVLSVEQAYVPLKAKPLMSTIQKDIDMRELFSVSDTYSYRLVITGEPGAGKTTVLQYMACTFAKALLEDYN